VSGGVAQWLAAEAREVDAARHQCREEEIAAWVGRILAGSGRVPVLKGPVGGGIEGGGSGNVADAWRKRGMSRGVPADRQVAPGRQWPETDGRA
jgi:hypothetical protein